MSSITASLETRLQREFALNAALTYVNHAAVGPWPRRTVDAVQAFARENGTYGASRYESWLQREQALRGLAAALINTATENIAWVKNTSEALSLVAHGFPWESGDEVVIAADEFPSNRLPWESLRERGVTVVEARLTAAAPEQALLAACTARTRILAVSSVQYATGLRLDVKPLGAECRRRGIALCVDAIQGLGIIPHDVDAMGIDFLMADGHKWLLAPEGLALFYCAPHWRPKLQLHQHGWRMTQTPGDYSRREWAPAASARRFEPGSPNMVGIYALHASLSLLAEIGIDVVERRVLARAECLFSAIERAPALALLTDTTPGRYAGIVTFRHRERSSEALHETLSRAGVVCALRGGGVRFSPHCYNDLKQLERAIALVAE